MTQFSGFEKTRYQQHDSIIREVVLDFNSNKAARCGCTEAQAANIPALTENLVKSWAIQESGGGDSRSLAAWRTDPLQVNVPGDWNSHKSGLGIKQPKVRNEGDIKSNLKAAVAYLCRKGFGKSGQAPANRPSANFDGWDVALRRYNGRTDIAANGKIYSQSYSNTIEQRAFDPKKTTKIEMR